jgi:hypothetical protein
MPHKPETQCAGNRRCLNQFDGHRIAKPVGSRIADERAARFVKAEIFIADVARWNKAVRASFVEFDEQAGAGDSRNMSIEYGADPIGKEMCDQPIGSLALGLHGAALGDRNIGGNFAERTRVSVIREPV